MQDYEKLGVFYLGRNYDLPARKSTSEPLLYKSKNLVTHGLVLGMTGSGKTGLCFDIIEEATLDGIPSLIVDPKGDLGNLLLTFPDLKPADFKPWVNEDEARKKGMSVQQFAAHQATLWRKGLAAWDQDGERIRRLRAAADFAVYTPGSTAGLPISILNSFEVPPADIVQDGELFRERIGTTVAGLLGLVGIEADPIRSRETILLSNLIQNAWSQGVNLDLAALIQKVQDPGFTKVGVLDLEMFYPARDRFALAMQLNNLLASPQFESWMQGEPLDVGNLLYTPSGLPRVSILSIAHLGDSERMFFVSMLLNQLLGWMRSQTGTSSLRALFYMDEIFGYFPPVANPPSKTPLLTLLKQGRAFGLGTILATQNPVDLDYKGLANIGSWFIGRIQTERDKARVLEGLEGAATGRGGKFDRAAMEKTLAGLGKRVFLLHDVHDDEFDIFETRWAMSYLRGPLSREQIKSLREERETQPPPSLPAAKGRSTPSAPPPVPVPAARSPDTRPVLPPGVPQFFVSAAGSPAGPVRCHPRLFGSAKVRFVDRKAKVDEIENLTLLTKISDSPIPVDWAEAEESDLTVDHLERSPIQGRYETCAAAAGKVKNYSRWSKDLTNWIYANHKLTLYRSPTLKLTSSPGEDERDFRIRLALAARERRDELAEKLRKKYAPKIARLNDRVRRAEAAVEREAGQAKKAKLDTVISLGSTLLGAFLGRKAVSSRTVGGAASTLRGASRSAQQAADVTRAAETVDVLKQQLAELDAEFQAETEAATEAVNAEELEHLEISPSKTNIRIRLVALVWIPKSPD